MVVETKPWDIIDDLKTDEDQMLYLDVVLESFGKRVGLNSLRERS